MEYFIAWMCLFPISSSICEYINRLNNPKNEEYSDDVNGKAALFWILVWLGVGYALYFNAKG